MCSQCAVYKQTYRQSLQKHTQTYYVLFFLPHREMRSSDVIEISQRCCTTLYTVCLFDFSSLFRSLSRALCATLVSCDCLAVVAAIRIHSIECRTFCISRCRRHYWFCLSEMGLQCVFVINFNWNVLTVSIQQPMGNQNSSSTNRAITLFIIIGGAKYESIKCIVLWKFSFAVVSAKWIWNNFERNSFECFLNSMNLRSAPFIQE